MKRANPRGYGSPYINVWGSDGELIDYQIDSFVFKYCEDDDDSCTIIYKTDDVYIRDSLSFQQDAQWKIQWGYLPSLEFETGLNSNIRKMYVRDIDTTYDRAGITSRITLSNLGSYLRQYDPRGAGSLMQGVSLATVVDNFCSTLGLKVKYDGVMMDSNGDLTISTELASKATPGFRGFNSAMGEGQGPIVNPDIKFAYFLNQLEQNREEYKVNKSSSLEKKPQVFGPNNLPQNFVLHEDMFQSNSAWQTIKKLILGEKTTGLKIVGRDDLLLITKRTLNKTPIHTYIYRGDSDGELLQFDSSKKRYKKSKAFDHRVGAWDAVIKQKTVQFVTADEIPNTNKLKNIVKADRGNIISPEQYKILVEASKSIKENHMGLIPLTLDDLKLLSRDMNTGVERNAEGHLTGLEYYISVMPVDFDGNEIQTTKTTTTYKSILGSKYLPGWDVKEETPIENWEKNFSGYYRAVIVVKGGKQLSKTNNLKNKPIIEKPIRYYKSSGNNAYGMNTGSGWVDGVEPTYGDHNESYQLKDNMDFSNTQNTSTPTDNTATLSQRVSLLPVKRFIDLGTNDPTAVNEILNELEEAENDTNPATFKAIGQPEMEAQEVLEILNVAVRDAGRYWIKELTHTITKQGGYIMTGDLVRNMLQGNSTDVNTKEVPVANEDENKTLDRGNDAEDAASYLLH